jgi:hypothetical protein
LEVVGASKQNITGRSQIKYANNMDLKLKLMIWMETSQKGRRFKKKKALKRDFTWESYALLKRGINNNQMTTWWCKLLYEVTHFYKKKWGHFYNEVTL